MFMGEAWGWPFSASSADCQAFRRQVIKNVDVTIMLMSYFLMKAVLSL
jgi:hypothetical protein